MSQSSTMEDWKGYLLASLYILTSFSQSLIYQNSFHESTKSSIRWRAGIIDVIYRKALTISSSAKLTSGVGDIVNLLAIDLERLQMLLQFIWMIWAAPLNIIIAVVLLYTQIGWVTFVGLGVMAISMVLNGAFAGILQKLQVHT